MGGILFRLCFYSAYGILPARSGATEALPKPTWQASGLHFPRRARVKSLGVVKAASEWTLDGRVCEDT